MSAIIHKSHFPLVNESHAGSDINQHLSNESFSEVSLFSLDTDTMRAKGVCLVTLIDGITESFCNAPTARS